MTPRVPIDPTIRVRGDQTYASLDDVEASLMPGSHVTVYEPESGLTGPAEVVEIDHRRRLVYLAVDWRKMNEPAASHGASWLASLLDNVLSVVRSLQREISRWPAIHPPPRD